MTPGSSRRVALAGLACLMLGCQKPKDEGPARADRPAPAPVGSSAVDATLALGSAAERLLTEAVQRARAATPVGSREKPAETDGKAPPDEERLTRLLLAGSPARIWAAFGLGRRCGAEASTVQPLLEATSGVWLAAPEAPTAQELDVLGRSIGSCQTRSAEATLSAWLAPAPAADADLLIRSAAAGLGTLADLTGTLTETSQAALLDAAAARKDPFLLYPLSRLRTLPEAVSQRLLEVAGSILVADRPGSRAFAILALGSAGGENSASALVQVLLSTNFSATERSAAAHALARLGDQGQAALDEAAEGLLGRGLPSEADSALWAPLRATLEALDVPKRAASELRKLSALAIPERSAGLPGATRRRLVWLRCRAADLLARDRTSSVTLTQCDPDSGVAFELSQVRVLGRSRIELGRRKTFEERLASPHPVVAQAALRLIASHVELGDVRAPLHGALIAAAEGTRATAAKILAAYPSRAHDPKHAESGPDPRIVGALQGILSASGEQVAEETVAAAMGAAAALSTLALKPLIEAHCKGARPALRGAAERALAMLGSPGQRCPGPARSGDPEPTVPALEPALVIEFDSDFGPLRLFLDQARTPHARSWVRQRLESGALTQGPVHATSPGFSVQFGDPDGDGFESALPAMETPLELTPWDFEPGAVGLSSYAPGAFGSQLLIALEPLPALWGRRVLLGRAEGPWHLLWPGDPIGNGRVVEQRN